MRGVIKIGPKLVVAAVLWSSAMLPTVACGGPAPTTTPPATYSSWQLEYRLIANFGGAFYCDPDFYPIGRPGQEETNAQAQFPAIRANKAEFAAILEQLGLPDKPDYTDQEKLSIYREHKKLTLGVQMTAADSAYQYTLRVGQNQGERIEGTVTKTGAITVSKREPSFNT